MNINREAKKDANRWAKAYMDYGTGAGTKRKHLKAELSKKMQDTAYAEAFDRELDNVEYSKVLKGIKTEHATKSVAINGKKVFRNTVRGISLAAGAYAFYTNNREGIDNAVNGIKIRIKNAVNKRKYKNNTKIVSMSDAKKAEAYLRSVGINAHYE